MKKIICLTVFLVSSFLFFGCTPTQQYNTVSLTTSNYSTYLTCYVSISEYGLSVKYYGSCSSKSSDYVFSNVKIDITGSATLKCSSIGTESTHAGLLISVGSNGSGNATSFDSASESYDYIYDKSTRVNSVSGSVKVPID